jgi:four helix bundle protein
MCNEGKEKIVMCNERKGKMAESGIKNFQDLNAWKKGHELLLAIYALTKSFPKDELYGLTSQMRRAAISVTSNIAEGFSRYHYKEKVNFYYNARGSISEIINLLVVARDLKLLKEEKWKELNNACNDVRMLINGLVRSLDTQLTHR